MIESLPDILRIVEAARRDGWVLEPEAKRLLSLAGLSVPRFALAGTPEEARRFASEIGYPVVAKVVSPRILHKSEVRGVAIGIRDEARLMEEFKRLRALNGSVGVLVEEMAAGGIELILGAKIDVQFGPMILLGMGGIGVEIYRDVALRMAPLTEKDAGEMIGGLKAHRLLEGYRGAEPVNRAKLLETLLTFSSLVMGLAQGIESVDINPLLCSARGCLAADARILLAR